jgi:hypothetical protein
LYHTKDLGITFGVSATKDNGLEKTVLRGWADASFGGGMQYPYGGGYIELNNGAVIWLARKLKFVPLSSCDAEKGAIVMIVKEMVYAIQLYEDMTGKKIAEPMIIMTDSKAAYDVIKNMGVTKHTAHLERWMFYARDLAQRGIIKCVLVTTGQMGADDKTKVVDKKKFQLNRSMQMNLPIDPD